MRAIIYIQGVQFRIDTQKPVSHVVIGQRDAEYFRPNITGKVDAMSVEDRRKLHAFAHDQTGGKFRLCPLDWANGEEAAQEATKAFAPPEWINISVKAITDIGQVHD